MCGIAGFSGDFGGSLLDRMGALLAHRGPDDAGTILFGAEPSAVGLAHRQLSIIDLSADGHQPMTTACPNCVDGAGRAEAGLWITFNGEIYNHLELRARLEAKGHVFRSRSDTEVLLHLYAEYGIEMVKELNGIFAFALYDGRDAGGSGKDGALWLVRDGFGIKPLYFVEFSAGLLFASEIKALLADPRWERALDPVGIDYTLNYLWTPAPSTCFKAVRKVEPGEGLLIRNGRVSRRFAYFDPPVEHSSPRKPADDLRQELIGCLSDAVERQLMADVPVGFFLSGGLDSSSVVAMARQLHPDRKLQCFTIASADHQFSEEGIDDDLPYAARVARHLNVNLNVVPITAAILDDLSTAIYHLDEPQADPASINVLLISRLASDRGIKVLLSGVGGDDIFAGYRRHHALMLERYWAWAPRPARRALAALSRKLPADVAYGRRIRRAFKYADLDGDERLASYFLWSEDQQMRRLYAPSWAAQISPGHVLSPLLHTLAKLPAVTHPLNKMLFLELKHFLADHNLNYTDKMSMAAGVEVRVPLLDPDLVAFAARLPSQMKQHRGEGKWLFKQAMKSYLPQDIVHRPKTGFGAPLRSWLRGPLRPLVADVLSNSAVRAREIFDPAELRALVAADAVGAVNAAYSIFAVMCFELWCRLYADRHPAEPPVSPRRPQNRATQGVGFA